MRLRFRKIHIHHFLSFDDATVDLSDRSYCLINGTNSCSKDAAKSNGSGKSTIFNALCWALTGETIQGLRSNVANIHFNDGCYVGVEFDVDGDAYSVTRYKNCGKMGNDLKISVGGEDRSGKGLRDSEEILNQYLPSLTPAFIGSVIILGQGFPYKFSSNTPSGRKEVLEKLSKSDYMIDDLKKRIEERSEQLSGILKDIGDSLIKLQTESGVYSAQLESAERERDALAESRDFESEIAERKKAIGELESSIEASTREMNGKSAERESLRESVLKSSGVKDERLNTVLEQYNQYNRELSDNLISLKSARNSLTHEIKRMESITDICPTCGQRIVGVHKPDTSEKRRELAELDGRIASAEDDIKANDAEYAATRGRILDMYKSETEDASSKICALTEEIDKIGEGIRKSNSSLEGMRIGLAASVKDSETHSAKVAENAALIDSLTKRLSDISADIESKQSEMADKRKHLDVVGKMNTLIKRDFRGFLLSGVISYINGKAKEYCMTVFGHDSIGLQLNGNNIDICFCGKNYENLSGGEKTKIDIIIQFALKKMIETFCRFSSNVLVLDEITDYLDQVGCDSVFKLISKEASGVESTFIISHHTDELSIPCDCVINVVKGEDGVSRIQ